MLFRSPQATAANPPPYAELRKHPVDGFSAGLVDDDNVYEWEITIFGYVTLVVFAGFWWPALGREEGGSRAFHPQQWRRRVFWCGDEGGRRRMD